MKQYLIAFLFGVGLVACCLVFFLIGKETGWQKGYEAAMNEPHKADTVEIIKTIEIEKPVPVVQWKDREKLVYVPVPVHDTTEVHDTLAIPREYRQYGDDRYEAVVSGIDPVLERIKINQKTEYITNTVVEKKRWSFSVTAGVGGVYDFGDRRVHGGPGVLFGGSYNF